jgi:hypothetical protein
MANRSLNALPAPPTPEPGESRWSFADRSTQWLKTAQDHIAKLRARGYHGLAGRIQRQVQEIQHSLATQQAEIARREHVKKGGEAHGVPTVPTAGATPVGPSPAAAASPPVAALAALGQSRPFLAIGPRQETSLGEKAAAAVTDGHQEWMVVDGVQVSMPRQRGGELDGASGVVIVNGQELVRQEVPVPSVTEPGIEI